MPKLIYRLLWLSHKLGQWLHRRFTPSGLVVLVGIIVSAIIGLDTNQSLAYQVFTFLLALLTIAGIARRFIRLRFQISRKLPRFGTVGLPLTYTITLDNLMPRPQEGLQICETIISPYPSFPEFLRLVRRLYKNRDGKLHAQAFYPPWFQYVTQRRAGICPVVEVGHLQPHSPIDITLSITPLHRGTLQLKGITVTCPDPLGLVKAEQTVILPQSILVLPKLYQVPPILLPGSRRYQSGGVTFSSSVGNSYEFRSLRDYRPEDSPRKIHWKSWAKTGKPVVREEQDEFFVRHGLILDTFVDDNDSERVTHELFEEAVAVAASFACEAQTQESLLDLLFVGLEPYCFTSGRGLGAIAQMLEILAAVVPCYDRPFDSLLPLVLERASLLSGCICVFLSWDDARKALVRHLEQLQIPVLVLLIDQDWLGRPEPESAANPHVLGLGHIQEGLMAL
jgi:uncharacterized protein (DUF58 family)